MVVHSLFRTLAVASSQSFWTLHSGTLLRFGRSPGSRCFVVVVSSVAFKPVNALGTSLVEAADGISRTSSSIRFVDALLVRHSCDAV